MCSKESALPFNLSSGAYKLYLLMYQPMARHKGRVYLNICQSSAGARVGFYHISGPLFPLLRKKVKPGGGSDNGSSPPPPAKVTLETSETVQRQGSENPLSNAGCAAGTYPSEGMEKIR